MKRFPPVRVLETRNAAVRILNLKFCKDFHWGCLVGEFFSQGVCDTLTRRIS